MMKITVELPDDVAQRPEAGRQVLEALAIEGYRSGALTHHEASQLLQLSRLEFEALLKRRNVDAHVYDVDDLQQDLATLGKIDTNGPMRRP